MPYRTARRWPTDRTDDRGLQLLGRYVLRGIPLPVVRSRAVAHTLGMHRMCVRCIVGCMLHCACEYECRMGLWLLWMQSHREGVANSHAYRRGTVHLSVTARCITVEGTVTVLGRLLAVHALAGFGTG